MCVQARRYAESLENAVWTNQFDNTANRRAHIETTGPEIWTQTGTYPYIPPIISMIQLAQMWS